MKSLLQNYKSFKESKDTTSWSYYGDKGQSYIEFKIDPKLYIEKVLNKMNIEYDYKSINPLAEGGHGFVIDIDHKSVLKITTDESEAYYANKLISIKEDNLINVYDVCEIKYDYQYVKLYAIHMEKLNLDVDDNVKNLFNYLHKNDISELDFKNNDIYAYKQWKNIIDACNKHDLPIDDLHSKNIGYRNNNIVFFDISLLRDIKKFDMSNVKEVFID